MSNIVTVSGISASAKVPSMCLAIPVNYMEYTQTHEKELQGYYILHGTAEESRYSLTIKNNSS